MELFVEIEVLLQALLSELSAYITWVLAAVSTGITDALTAFTAALGL